MSNYTEKYIDFMMKNTDNEVKRVGGILLENVEGVWKLLGWDKPFTGRIYLNEAKLTEVLDFLDGKDFDIANIVTDKKSPILRKEGLFTTVGEPFAFVDLSGYDSIDDFIKDTFRSTRNRMRRWYNSLINDYDIEVVSGTDEKAKGLLNIMMDLNISKFGADSIYNEARDLVLNLCESIGDEMKVLVVRDAGNPIYVTGFMLNGNTIVHHNSGTTEDNLGRVGWLLVFDWCLKNGVEIVEEMNYYAPYKETMGCKFETSIQITNMRKVFENFNAQIDLIGEGNIDVWCNRRDGIAMLKTNALVDKKFIDFFGAKLESEKYELATLLVFDDGVKVGSIPVTTSDGWKTCKSIFPLKHTPDTWFIENKELINKIRREVPIDIDGLQLPFSYVLR